MVRLLFCVFTLTTLLRADEPLYRQATTPVEQRVADLLARMTPQEKAAQLDVFQGKLLADPMRDDEHAARDAHFLTDTGMKLWADHGAGGIQDLYPTARLSNEIQSWVMQHSRLGIPVLFIGEGLHGAMDFDETIFPSPIGLGGTFDRDLARQTGAAIGAEMRANGIDMVLAPVLDLARDPRWGRVEEDMGEDPYLTGQMGLAYVNGAQGDSLATDHTIIAEPKHFAGHGSPEGGLNLSSVHVGEREMRMVMLKSFEPALRQGHAMGAMVAYHDIDGIPCIDNPWLLLTVLRQEWGFQGLTFSDEGAIARLLNDHHTAATPQEAIWQAVNSGVDLQYYDFDHVLFQQAIVDGLKNGKLASSAVDRAVSDVLRAKFMLGLFDHPLVDANLDKSVRHHADHVALSLRCARESICLLKNDNHLLPLNKATKVIAVLGRNGETAQLGDYSDGAAGRGLTIVQALHKLLPGADVLSDKGDDISAAVAKAKQADVAILALGEWSGDGGSGEGIDKANLDLPAEQEKLLEAVVTTGKPVVLVLQNGRPLSIVWAADHVPAILEAWYPGELGGQAIVETLVGDNNPAGRLPVSFPRSVGQLPDFYNCESSARLRDYTDLTRQPLYTFGSGLSYTTFTYDQPTVAVMPPESPRDIVVTCHVTNSGQREGDEVLQLYLRQDTASVVTPVRSLKAFERIKLRPGETRAVSFHVARDDLAIWGAQQKWAVEPGNFTLWVGGSSAAQASVHFTLP